MLRCWAAYIFRQTGSAWGGEDALIRASYFGAGGRFGGSVALAQDTLLVGTIGEDGNDNNLGSRPNNNFSSNSGAVYRFRRRGTNWQQEFWLQSSNTDAGDASGASIVLTDNPDAGELITGVIHKNPNQLNKQQWHACPTHKLLCGLLILINAAQPSRAKNAIP